MADVAGLASAEFSSQMNCSAESDAQSLVTRALSDFARHPPPRYAGVNDQALSAAAMGWTTLHSFVTNVNFGRHKLTSALCDRAMKTTRCTFLHKCGTKMHVAVVLGYTSMRLPVKAAHRNAGGGEAEEDVLVAVVRSVQLETYKVDGSGLVDLAPQLYMRIGDLGSVVALSISDFVAHASLIPSVCVPTIHLTPPRQDDVVVKDFRARHLAGPENGVAAAGGELQEKDAAAEKRWETLPFEYFAVHRSDLSYDKM